METGQSNCVRKILCGRSSRQTLHSAVVNESLCTSVDGCKKQSESDWWSIIGIPWGSSPLVCQKESRCSWGLFPWRQDKVGTEHDNLQNLNWCLSEKIKCPQNLLGSCYEKQKFTGPICTWNEMWKWVLVFVEEPLVELSQLQTSSESRESPCNYLQYWLRETGSSSLNWGREWEIREKWTIERRPEKDRKRERGKWKRWRMQNEKPSRKLIALLNCCFVLSLVTFLNLAFIAVL